jgi:hypothetical protein
MLDRKSNGARRKGMSPGPPDRILQLPVHEGAINTVSIVTRTSPVAADFGAKFVRSVADESGNRLDM